MSTRPEYVSIATVAARLGVSRVWARKLIEREGIAWQCPGVRVRLVHADDLEALVLSRRTRGSLAVAKTLLEPLGHDRDDKGRS